MKQFKSFTEAMTATFRSQSPNTFLHEFKNLSLNDKLDFYKAFISSGYTMPPPVKPKEMSQEEYNAKLKEYGISV